MQRASSAAMTSTRTRTRTRTLHRVRAVLFPMITAWLALCASACNPYAGSATTLKPNELKADPGWVRVDGVPELRQKHELDCGPTALAMVLGFHEKDQGAASHGMKEKVLSELPTDERIAATQLRDLARKHGFNSFVMEGKPEDLVYELSHGRPVIVGVAKPTIKDALAHYEVVVGLHRETQRVALIDPDGGLQQNSFGGFLMEWQGAGRVLLVVIPKGADKSEKAETPQAQTVTGVPSS
jgi:ABC-type bacteriocin/lantibiotic exporter with double-glycine peptidase domain